MNCTAIPVSLPIWRLRCLEKVCFKWIYCLQKFFASAPGIYWFSYYEKIPSTFYPWKFSNASVFLGNHQWCTSVPLACSKILTYERFFEVKSFLLMDRFFVESYCNHFLSRFCLDSVVSICFALMTCLAWCELASKHITTGVLDESSHS